MKNCHSEFFPTIFLKKTSINSEWLKWLFQIFSDNFSQKDWYKFRMAKNGHSKFFLAVFPKDWYKFRMVKTGHSNFFDNFPQKDWFKFRMIKNGHSEFFLTIFLKKTGINS